MSDMDKIEEVIGSGGGGGKKGGGGGGSSASDTLRSKGRARLVEAISEGPIVGLVNGAKSIYLDETPIENEDGSLNYDNVGWDYRLGLPDDTHFNGHAAVEQLESVEIAVENGTGPVTRTITDPNADATRVIIRIDSMFKIDKKGNAQRTNLNYKIEMRPFGGVFSTEIVNDLRGEKTTSAVQIGHRIELPVGGHPWDIRVTRVTPDDADDKIQRSMTFESYTTLTEGRFVYPHTALVSMEIEAEKVGERVPQRAYHIMGRIISVPSNYDPVSRTYSGIWDGTFKQAWTNNPAWIFHDLLENDRYGLGSHVNPSERERLKWQLYTIGRYCDQLVPSGYKTEAGANVMEPRFTYNGVIRNREEAYNVLQKLTTAFRGMGYWALGQVFATADMPSDPVKLVTPSNVINGRFSYSSTAFKARHSVVMVRWNNPNDFYKTATEVVINNDALIKYGWREKTIDYDGCTSRGLARRYGNWILDVENNETETVEYKASLDHMDALPGQIVAIADPRKASVRMGGRIFNHVAHSGGVDRVELDSQVEFASLSGGNYKLWLTLPDGTLEEIDINSIDPDLKTVYIPAQAQRAAPAAVFIVTGSEVVPAQYRIISVSETDENVFQVTALLHDPNKYARVEQGIYFDPLPVTREFSARPPQDVQVSETAYVDENQIPRSRLRIEWKAPEGVIVREYVIRADTPSENKKFLGVTQNTYFEVEGLEADEHTFYVTTIDRRGNISRSVTAQYVVEGSTLISEGSVADLELVDAGGSTEFFGRDVAVSWSNVFPDNLDGDPGQSLALYDFNTVKIFDQDTNTLLRTAQVRGSEFIYLFDWNKRDCATAGLSVNATRFLRFEVTVTSKRNNTSAPANLVVSNPVPQATTPNVRKDGSVITVAMPDILDTDARGMKVWIEDNPTFDPAVTTPRFNGLGSFMTWTGAPARTYYVRAGYYDYFDDQVNVSQSVEVVTDVVSDFSPPDTPTGLALSSELLASGMARVTATWNANAEENLAHYELVLTENGGNEVSFTTSTTTKFWDVMPGTTLTVKIMAVGPLASRSAASIVETITAATDSIPPAVPANLSADPGFGGMWLGWTHVADADLSHYEIKKKDTSAVPNLSVSGDYTSTADTFYVGNMGLAETAYFWVRAVDTSGNKSGWSSVASGTTTYVDLTNATGQITAAQIGANEVITNAANIKNAVITSAKIASLSAAKIQAGTALANSVTVGGTALGTIGDRAANPAARINAASTQIDPGKIVISGATSLSDWRGQLDQTKIFGGNIETNSISAQQITVGDYTDFADGSNFEDPAFMPWDILDTETEISTLHFVNGTKSLRLKPRASSTDINRARLSNPVACTPGDNFVLTFWARMNADFDGTAASGIEFSQPDGTVIGSATFEELAPDTWEKQKLEITAPDDIYLMNVDIIANNTLGDIWLDQISIKRQIESDLVINGSVTLEKLDGDVLNADNITAGSMSVARINVDEILNIDSENAGFSMNKIGAYDITNDGLYMGRTLEIDGSTGFGFSASKTNPDGLIQQFEMTGRNGLQFQNAQFFRELYQPATSDELTSDQTISIPSSIKRISFDIMAGGGGGRSGNRYDYRPGTDGGDTVVELLDGGTVIQTWTTLGGRGGSTTSGPGMNYGQDGESTALGQGGAGGRHAYSIPRSGSGENSTGGGSVSATPGGHATGYGAGGGGGGTNKRNRFVEGGKAGQFIQITNLDLTSYGLADPQIRVTVGSAGAGNGSNEDGERGGNGSPGIVKVIQMSEALVPADVIPLVPTQVGTMSNQGPFPDLGSGFWVLTTAHGTSYQNDVALGTVATDDTGFDQQFAWGNSVSFVSAKTPVVTSNTYAARTLEYKFYRMG